jgi:hypothetical protein
MGPLIKQERQNLGGVKLFREKRFALGKVLQGSILPLVVIDITTKTILINNNL